MLIIMKNPHVLQDMQVDFYNRKCSKSDILRTHSNFDFSICQLKRLAESRDALCL